MTNFLKFQKFYDNDGLRLGLMLKSSFWKNIRLCYVPGYIIHVTKSFEYTYLTKVQNVAFKVEARVGDTVVTDVTIDPIFI